MALGICPTLKCKNILIRYKYLIISRGLNLPHHPEMLTICSFTQLYFGGVIICKDSNTPYSRTHISSSKQHNHPTGHLMLQSLLYSFYAVKSSQILPSAQILTLVSNLQSGFLVKIPQTCFGEASEMQHKLSIFPFLSHSFPIFNIYSCFATIELRK